MKIFFKRSNSVGVTIFGWTLFIIGVAILFSPFVTGYDMLSGFRNLVEFSSSLCLMSAGAYILVDWDEMVEYMDEYEDDEYDDEY